MRQHPAVIDAMANEAVISLLGQTIPDGVTVSDALKHASMIAGSDVIVADDATYRGRERYGHVLDLRNVVLHRHYGRLSTGARSGEKQGGTARSDATTTAPVQVRLI
jgi:hypothetical protein